MTLALLITKLKQYLLLCPFCDVQQLCNRTVSVKLIAAKASMLFNHLKYKHLPVCNHPPAWLVVSKLFYMNCSTELITWIMNYDHHVFGMNTPPAAAPFTEDDAHF